MRSCYYFQDEDVQIHQSPPRPGIIDHGHQLSQSVTPTPIPLGFTTTIRPPNASPRVKSNIRNNGQRHGHLSTARPVSRPSPPPPAADDIRSFVPPLIQDNDVVEDVTEQPIVNPFDNPPFISADGKKPRVKANLNTKFAHNNNNKDKFEKNEKQNKKQGSKKVELDRSQFANINFVSPTPSSSGVTPFPGPEVRPDGRQPRVKSNVLAAERDQGPSGTSPAPPADPTPRSFARPRPLPFNNNNNFDTDFRFNEIDDGFDPSTQSVSPSTIKNNIFINTTPEPIFSSTFRDTFNDVTPRDSNTFRPFAATASPPRFSIVSSTPGSVNRSPSTTRPPVTFQLPPPSRPRPTKFNNFNLGPPPQPKLPPGLPPPANRRPLQPSPTRRPSPSPKPSPTRRPTPRPTPSPTLPPSQQPLLQRDRNRFGARPRVKANELAQKANQGNIRHKINIGESPRNSFVQSGGDRGDVTPNRDEIIPGVIVTQQPRSRPSPSRSKFNVRFKTRNDITNKDPCVTNPFKCPPRKSADGRKPRVKSNIKAARRNFWHPRKGRVIKKQRKQGKLNAALWNRGIIRQGRKQSLSSDKSNAIDNNIDDEPITTTQDPIRSLKQIVASKEKQPSKTFKAFPAARSFQNKRLRLKQKINHRDRNSNNAFHGTTATTFSNNNFVITTTPTTFAETTAASTTSKVSLFVTNPNFHTSPAPPQPGHGVSAGASVTNHSPLSMLPDSRPTQSAPEKNPFTQPDMGLFVTNPRALQEQSLANEDDENRNLFNNPPERAPNDRRPRVKSNIMAKFKNTHRGHGSSHRHHEDTTESLGEEELITTTETVKPVLRIVPDGRSPRVKSNLLNKSSNRKHHQKNGFKHKFKGSGRRKFGRSLDLSNDNENEIEDASDEEFDVDFEDVEDDNGDNLADEYIEPEVRPDGRKPRIKSNILAKKSVHRKNKASGKHFSKLHKKGKSGFRHSKKVPQSDTSFRSSDETSPSHTALNNLIDGTDTDNAITTFRPVISLEELMNTNETFPSPSAASPAPPPPPAAAAELSVPLPNFDKSIIAGFEPAFSDMTNSSDDRQGRHPPAPLLSSLPQSVTEIVRVSSADQNLFSSDYSYYDYYDEFINST